STSRPVQSPLSFGAENPARPVLTPHCRKPLALTSSSVVADAAEAVQPSAATPSRPIRNLFIPETLCCCSGPSLAFACLSKRRSSPGPGGVAPSRTRSPFPFTRCIEGHYWRPVKYH